MVTSCGGCGSGEVVEVRNDRVLRGRCGICRVVKPVLRRGKRQFVLWQWDDRSGRSLICSECWVGMVLFVLEEAGKA